MKFFLLNIFLALTWMALTGNFNPINLLIGFTIGYLTLFIVRPALNSRSYFTKGRQLFEFALFFARELVVANLRVARDVLTPRHYMQPRIIAIPLDAHTDVEITALSYFISLTPGTLSLDVSTDRRVLFIHAMYAADADTVRREIKEGIERRLLELIR